MTLSEKLAEKFETEFTNVFEKEKQDKDYLNQEEFDTCKDRATAGIIAATEAVIVDLAYCIAVHREKEHKDNTIDEQASLLEAGADPEIGTMSWWNDSKK